MYQEAFQNEYSISMNEIKIVNTGMTYDEINRRLTELYFQK